MKILELINLHSRVNYVENFSGISAIRNATKMRAPQEFRIVMCGKTLECVCKLVKNNKKKQPKQIDAEGKEAKNAK